jgi:alpha-tubulin suppressor-like RCC1 family protein
MIACGANFSLGLDAFGVVFAWGDGSTGAMGSGNLNNVFEPTPIDF